MSRRNINMGDDVVISVTQRRLACKEHRKAYGWVTHEYQWQVVDRSYACRPKRVIRGRTILAAGVASGAYTAFQAAMREAARIAQQPRETDP